MVGFPSLGGLTFGMLVSPRALLIVVEDAGSSKRRRIAGAVRFGVRRWKIAAGPAVPALP